MEVMDHSGECVIVICWRLKYGKHNCCYRSVRDTDGFIHSSTFRVSGLVARYHDQAFESPSKHYNLQLLISKGPFYLSLYHLQYVLRVICHTIICVQWNVFFPSRVAYNTCLLSHEQTNLHTSLYTVSSCTHPALAARIPLPIHISKFWIHTHIFA